MQQSPVAWALADRAEVRAGALLCWPALSTIATDLDMDRTNVARHLKCIEEAGWIIRESGGPKRNTRYSLVIPNSVVAPAPLVADQPLVAEEHPVVADTPLGSGPSATTVVAPAPHEVSIEVPNEVSNEVGRLSYVSNAGAGARETTAIRPASIFVEKNQPFIPEDKKNTAPRYAEWQHLLRRDLIVELEDIAQQIVDENNLAGLTDLADDAVQSTVDWLLTAYSESTRPQTRNGIHIWLMEIRPEPDVPLFQSVLSTLHRRAS